jgi:hypothetical protein
MTERPGRSWVWHGHDVPAIPLETAINQDRNRRHASPTPGASGPSWHQPPPVCPRIRKCPSRRHLRHDTGTSPAPHQYLSSTSPDIQIEYLERYWGGTGEVLVWRYVCPQRGALEHSGRSCRTDGSGVTIRACWSANPQVGLREMLVGTNWSHSPFRCE